MIVDIHTHVWESPEQLGRGSAQRLLRHAGQPWERPDASPTAHDAAMEPVQHAVILGFESVMLGASISAEQVAKCVQRKPGKYLGFAGIDPLAGKTVARIDHARSLGLVGVTISPAAQGFHPSHTAAWPLYEACAEAGLPLLVHAATHLSSDCRLEFAQPVLMDEVAREFPRLRIILSQVGYPWLDETLVLLGKHRNVFADLSHVVTRPWQLYNLLHSAHQQGVMDRLLFGSDFPFCTPQKAITTIYSVNTLTQGTMLPSVPREQLRSIVERDVLELLGLRKKNEKPESAPAKPAAVVMTPATTVTAKSPVPAMTAATAATAPMTPAASQEDAGPDDEESDSSQAKTPVKAAGAATPAGDAAGAYELDDDALDVTEAKPSDNHDKQDKHDDHGDDQPQEAK